jgi:DNA mismatch endonuclease (patch repair protein)
MGYRYRLHRKDLPGKPDLVFGPRKKVIEVRGCYWHAHQAYRDPGAFATLHPDEAAQARYRAILVDR